MRGVLMVLLLLAVFSTPRVYAILGELVDGVKDMVSAVADTAVDAAKGVGHFIQDTFQAGEEAMAPDTPCYEPLGCFPMEDPWWSVTRLVPAPQSPHDVDIKFYLYTRKQRKRYYIQTRPDVSVDESADYNADRMTVMITHGFQSNGTASWLEDMTDAVLHKIDANVIIVDWGKGACEPGYFISVANARVVAAEIRRVCWYLIKNQSMTPSKLHLVGHSIGAHIMSYVKYDNITIARITGLDPAGALFEGYSEEVFLDPSDATFVDLVHTDAVPVIPSCGLGFVNPSGHVDFFINNGSNQPNCSETDDGRPKITALSDLDNAKDIISCSHRRANEVWISSLLYDNCTFLGYHTNESENSVIEKSPDDILNFVTPMGLETNNFPGRGSFYVTTTGSEPFCVENFKVQQIYDAAVTQLKSKG